MKDLVFLIVDDSQAVRSLVKTAVFSQFGSRNIFTAGNGLQAKDILLSKRVDVIISDWEMPKMSGQELLAFVKQSEKLKDIPFVMMTSRGGKESVLEAIQNGVSHYVIKPFTIEKLEDAVRRSWNSSRQRKETRIAGLPKHRMKISASGKVLDGQIQNISRSGALLDLQFDQAVSLFSELKLHISMTFADATQIQLRNLVGRIIRLEASNSGEAQDRACSVAMVFEYEKCERKTLEALNYLIEAVSSAVPKVVNNPT